MNNVIHGHALCELCPALCHKSIIGFCFAMYPLLSSRLDSLGTACVGALHSVHLLCWRTSFCPLVVESVSHMIVVSFVSLQWEGGIRVAALLNGGFLPATARGKTLEGLAVYETGILLHPPLPLSGVSAGINRGGGCHQNHRDIQELGNSRPAAPPLALAGVSIEIEKGCQHIYGKVPSKSPGCSGTCSARGRSRSSRR